MISLNNAKILNYVNWTRKEISAQISNEEDKCFETKRQRDAQSPLQQGIEEPLSISEAIDDAQVHPDPWMLDVLFSW